MTKEEIKNASDADLASRYKEMNDTGINNLPVPQLVECTRIEDEIIARWLYEQGVKIDA